MSTLIAVSGLGIVCLLLEILNLRKILVPVTLLGLLGILGLTFAEFYLDESFFPDTSDMIVSTRFSQGFSILFIILAALVIVMSPEFYKNKMEKIADYVSLKIFLLAGAVAMVSFGNLSMFFIGIEVLSIAGYVLASSSPSRVSSNEAGMKYFIMGAFASSFILFGIALVYGAIGSFNIETISVLSNLNGGDSLPVWFNIGFIMILVGLLFKASVVPFHFWAPDVYEGSPTIVTTLMSTLVKVAAIATLYKVVVIFGVAMTSVVQTSIVVFSILSLTIGNITALNQKSLKRMMAYSGISHAGFMIMDLLSTENNASNTLLYYAAAYSFAGIAAFAVIMAVSEGKGHENVENLHGLARRNPLLAGILTCALVSLGGIPIFAGFFAKLFMFTQMIEARFLILVIFGIINSIIAIFYYFGAANVMFTKDPSTEAALKVPVRYIIVASVAIVLNLILGIYPSLIMALSL